MQVEKIVFTTCLLLSTAVFAHKGEKHSAKPEIQDTSRLDEREKLPNAHTKINAEYQQKIEPIFTRSCGDCHGSATRKPWYYKIPGVKQMIESDIEEARNHLTIENGFPFGGHGTPLEDLDSIEKSISDGSMPPFRYRIMHWSADISDREMESIKRWIQLSRKQFQEGSIP